MKTLVLANQKGGVGKSAIATQLALYAAKGGLRVCVIDLDHQQNSSRPLRQNDLARTMSIPASAALRGEPFEPDQDAQLLLVGGDDALSALERDRERHNAFAANLRTMLRKLAGFDLCVIDTNPNPDIRYASALVSADYVLAPVQLNQEALEGISGLLGHPRYGLGKIKAALNPKLTFLGILPNMVEPTPFQRQNLAMLTASHGGRLLKDGRTDPPAYRYIPKRSAIAEAQAAGIFLPDLKKTAARDAWREVEPAFATILNHMGLNMAMLAAQGGPA